MGEQIMGFLSGILRTIKGWFTPSKPRPAGYNVEKRGTNQDVSIIYGEVKEAPCIKVFVTTTDKKGGAKNEYLHFICVFSVGEIEGIGDLYFNGISQDQINSERYFIKRFNGSENQTYCTELAANFSQWKSTAKLKNVAYAYVRLKQNKDVDWWQGEPTITADIQGLKVLDVRDNQLKYSNNSALCLYDYLTNTNYGQGLATNKLDTQSFINAADFIETTREYTRTIYKTRYDKIAREWVDILVGTVKETVIENLFSCNVSLSGDNTIFDNVGVLLGGMRASLPESSGKYRLGIEKDDSPVFAFTKDNIQGAVQCSGGNQSDRYNQVGVTFRNKLTGADDEVFYPESDALHQEWKTEDRGKLLLGKFDFDTIHNKAEALQMAHVIANLSRHTMSAAFIGTAETMVVEAGDIVTVDSVIIGWDAKQFRIKGVETDLLTGVTTFQAVEHQPSIYPWAIGDVVEKYVDTSHSLPQDIDAPTGLSYETLADGEAFIGKLSWDDPNDVMVTGYKITVNNTETNNTAFSQETSELHVNIARLPEGEYTASIVAKNSLFISEAAVLVFTVALPGVPTVNVDSVGSNSVTMSASIQGVLSLNTTFQWQFIGTDEVTQEGNIVQGSTYTFTGLHPETAYKFKCRSINVAGSSSWINVEVNTTASEAGISEELQTVLDGVQAELDSIPDEWEAMESSLSSIFTTALITKDNINITEALDESYRNRDIVLSELGEELKVFASGMFPIGHTQISDGAIRSPAIAANAVTAINIVAQAISTDKLAVNAVTTDILSAGAVTTDKIMVGAIIAELIGANQILAGHIAAGTITTDKLVAGIIFGEDAYFKGELVAATGYFTGGITAQSLTMSGRFLAEAGGNKIDFDPITGKCEIVTTSMTMKGGNGAEFKVSESSQGNTAFLFKDSAGAVRVMIADSGNITAQSTSGNGIADFFSNGNSPYSFYGSKRIWAGDGVSPFTGSHIGIRREKTTYELGDLMVRLSVLTKPDINNSMSLLALSSKHKQKTCYGVIADDTSIMEQIGLAKKLPMGLTQEQIEIEDRLITINSVGEGLINVCGLGGNIENGDNLCSSSILGKAQLQGDDLIYNYTVAESHENVTFDYPEQVKQIACTYKF